MNTPKATTVLILLCLLGVCYASFGDSNIKRNDDSQELNSAETLRDWRDVDGMQDSQRPTHKQRPHDMRELIGKALMRNNEANEQPAASNSVSSDYKNRTAGQLMKYCKQRCGIGNYTVLIDNNEVKCGCQEITTTPPSTAPPTTTTPPSAPPPTTTTVPSTAPPTTTTPPTTPISQTPNMEVCVADIVFVLDNSQSIGDANWKYMLSFAQWMVDRLGVGYNLAHVALVDFGEKGHVDFDLNDYMTRQEANQAISNISYRGEDTNTTGGLYWGRKVLTDPAYGLRENVPKVLILVTDGVPMLDREKLQAEVDLLKSANIRLIAVGVGDQVNQTLLKSIASSPSEYFQVENFQALGSVVDTVINQDTCLTPVADDETIRPYKGVSANITVGATGTTATLLASVEIDIEAICDQYHPKPEPTPECNCARKRRSANTRYQKSIKRYSDDVKARLEKVQE